MKIFAHRGFSHEYPEGTRAAYEGAVRAGADGFECDVRLTRDNKVICFHDRTTKRLTGTSKKIARMGVEEIRSLYDAMTLNELLDLAIKERKDILIETKHPVHSGAKIEKAVLQLLRDKNSEIQSSRIKVTVMSFSYVAVWRLRRSYPHVAKVIKYSIPAFLTRAPNIAINIEVLRRFPILLKIKKNSEIYTWTVNSDEDMLWIQDKRISGVITDNVGKAKTLKP